MTSIQRSRKALIGLAAFASVAAILPFTNTAQALPPGTAPAGLAVLSPASGTNATGFSIGLPPTPAGTGAVCPGDGVNGYRWGTYIMPITSDPASTIYDGVGSPTGPAVTSSIRNPSGTFIRGQLPGTGDGLINQAAAGYSWIGLGATGVLPAGAYNVGIACTLNVGVPPASSVEVQKFWNTQITVTSTGATTFSYSTGVVPSAPVLTTSSYNAGTTTATVNFTHAASLPATTGYTATVTGSPAIAPITVPAGATSFQIPGVALGSSYTVSLVATNTVGNSAPSNTLTVSGAASSTAPVPTASSAFVNTPFTINWTAAVPAPASYTVAITPAGPAYTVTGVTGLSQAFPAGLAVGSYTVTVTPVYAAGSGVTGTPGVGTFSVNPNALIVQELTVTRPAGALILTQRCGVNNALPAIPVIPGFPGNPRPVPAQGATADQVGTSPDIDLISPGVQVDPEFGNYPLPSPPSGPATYPTECGLNMGTAQFVTQGDLAGQFFHAYGALNEVTVLDTRNGDAGWTLRGDIEDRFTSAANSDSFSGDYLGWQPVMSGDSGEVGGEGPNGVGALYNQTVTAGNGIPAGTGFATAGIGLTDNPVLASAPANSGLGIATLDAVVFLLIPTSVDAANYSGTLTLTVA